MTGQALETLQAYLTTARWFGGKGRDISALAVRRAGLLPPDEGTEPTLAVDLVTVSYADGGDDETYQVPLALYAEAQERLEHAFVGSWTEDELGEVHAYDAVHDRDASALWLKAFWRAADAPDLVEHVGDLSFHRMAGYELDTDTHSTLFSGEQSNSSLAFGEDSLMKVFRKVTPGRNPDIVIHRALTEHDNEHVASLYGWVELADGPGPSTGSGRGEPYQLAMLQQFLRTASDGWGLALASVRDLFAEADLHADEVGGDFDGEAERLGLATAAVHDVLAEQFDTEQWAGPDLEALAAAMGTRLDAALQVVPELAEHAEGLRRTFAAVADLGSSGRTATAQRVHGDFHLGQTLRTVKGWKIVDFEGEPAKPLAERVKPDLVWRDVAGMLRSLDYAAHAVIPDFAADLEADRQISFRAAEWAERNQQAFLRGYVETSDRTEDDGLSVDQETVLRAYVADKAVYEAVYEARNRPSWLPIPLGAIARTTQATTSSPATATTTPHREANAP